jgi:hypothetical protein
MQDAIDFNDEDRRPRSDPALGDERLPRRLVGASLDAALVSERTDKLSPMAHDETLEALAAGVRANLDRGEAGWNAWLVFADYLAQTGDPRGQLITLEHQIAFATEARRLEALRAEVEELRAREPERLQPALPQLPEDCELELRHGFAVGLVMPLTSDHLAPLAQLLAHPDSLLLARLRMRPPLAHELEAEPDYEAGEEPVPTVVDEELVGALLALELDRLTAFAFEYGHLGPGGAAQLAACPRFAELRSLDLRYSFLLDEELGQLLASPRLPSLRELHLQRNRLGPEAARLLVSPRVEPLRVLDLRDNAIGPEGAAALAGSPKLRALESLGLYFGDVGLEGAAALAASPHLPFFIRRYWAAQRGAHDRA